MLKSENHTLIFLFLICECSVVTFSSFFILFKMHFTFQAKSHSAKCPCIYCIKNKLYGREFRLGEKLMHSIQFGGLDFRLKILGYLFSIRNKQINKYTHTQTVLRYFLLYIHSFKCP